MKKSLLWLAAAAICFAGCESLSEEGEGGDNSAIGAPSQVGESKLTPGQHQENIEKIGIEFTKYFNAEDSQALAESLLALYEYTSYDEYDNVVVPVPDKGDGNLNTAAPGLHWFVTKLLGDLVKASQFDVQATTRASMTITAPDEIYKLDDFKGRAYSYNTETEEWSETSLGNVNKMEARWDNSVATLSWEEGTASWEGFKSNEDVHIKAENIPSAINLSVVVNNKEEMTIVAKPGIINNKTFKPEVTVTLHDLYVISTSVDASVTGIKALTSVAKEQKEILSAAAYVSANDLTDSDKWLEEDFLDEDNLINIPKTGEALVKILDLGIAARGDFRAVMNVVNEVEDPESKAGAEVIRDAINQNAQAYIYYIDKMEKVANVKAKLYKEEDSWSDYVYYEIMPVLVFSDQSEFAIENYFTADAFSDAMDALGGLIGDYGGLVD